MTQSRRDGWRLFTVAAIAFFAAAIALPARAQTLGGAGGSYSGAGGGGGLSNATSPGNVGGNGITNGGGGGGGAGTTGGSGGVSGGSNGGGSGGASAGESGSNGSDGPANGAGGGGGGAHGAVVTTTTSNSTTVTGGNGGSGGTATDQFGPGGGGGGGAGGYGTVVNASGLTYTNTGSGTITGGNGGGGGGSTGVLAAHAGNGGAGGYGIDFTGSGTLVNSGTITGGNGGAGGAGSGGASSGASAAGGAGIYGSNLAITNSGTITGGLGGDGVTRANAITFTGGANSLTLQAGSTITGNIETDGSLTFDQNTTQTLGNVITGNGSVVQNGTGTLILNGVNTYTGSTTVSTGTLEVGDSSHASASLAGNVTVDASGTLAGHGTVGGDVTNSAGGIVAPGGTIGTLTVTGNYTQGSNSTLSIEVSPSAASKLDVTGTATLAGTLKLVYDPGVYSTKTYDIVHAGTVTGTFGTVSGTAPSGFNQSISYTTTDVDLGITSTTVAPTTDTSIPDGGTTALDGGQDANNTLLGYLGGGPTGGAFNAGADDRATDQTAAMPLQIAFAGSTAQLGELVASLPAKMNELGGWFRGLGEFANLNGGATPGFTTQSGGFLAGIDRPVADHLTAGIAFGYSRTNLNVHDGESGTIDTPRLMLYGRDDFGTWALDGAVGYAYDRINLSRSIASVGEAATSTHDGHEATAAMQATTKLTLGRLSLVPAAGFEYVHLYETGFTESGAPGNNLTVSSRNSDSLRPFLGVTAKESFTSASGTVWTPEADLAYSHELFATPPSLVQVGGGSFTVSALAPSRDQVTIGTGVIAAVSGQLDLFADYHATLPADRQSVGAGRQRRTGLQVLR
ncbi:MAG: autotransporter domain-containing protein [Alphaproteobacteria bacterium]|nr:autotransporter domain-containing protein [Alphaproteobacteria bacterium]